MEKERDLNPPEPKETYEQDIDAINDYIWLKEQEEKNGKR